jgi:IS5 family transposase
MQSIAPSETSSVADQSVTGQMTALYTFIDDYLKAHPGQAQWRRSPNRAPASTDAEVITIGLMQGVFGCATLKKAYLLVASGWRDAFPRLCNYQQWLARLHRLSALVGHLLQAALGVQCLDMRLYLLDGKPIPVCKPIRHGRVRLLREDGAYFGKGSTGWFFGFKLHVLAHHTGSIVGAILTPGNHGERDVAVALGLSVDGGVVLADLGYTGGELSQALAEEADLLLLTPADAGEKGSERRRLHSCVRERVECTFSALWDRFVDRVLSRSWQGLWSTVKLKMLHFNLCQAGVITA